jgi:hypothetical protein
MKITKLSASLPLACLLAISALFTGCQKQAESQAPPPPAPDAAAQPAAPAQPAAAPAVRNVAPDANLTEAQTAMKAHDYEKAVDALLAVQRQRQLSEQQAALYQSQMRTLQRDLAGALARGDPAAKAAADKLRASASGTH